jgi:RNA polymerase sigma-70 factor (ECF subfamily)
MITGTHVRREPDAATREQEGGSATASARSPHVTFEVFYRAEYARLLRFFQRKVGRDDAPDLTQEAFMRFFRSGAFERIEYPEAYLARIARNLWLNRIRQQKRSGILYPLDEACDAPIPPDQERQFEAMELRRAYRRALRPLSRKTRRVFLMHRLRGMTYQNIADELGISNKAVEKRIGRALARCRKVAARYS